MHNFTPLPALLGRALIGVAASLLLYFHGRIAGVSGILAGALELRPGDVGWRVWFLGGLVLGGLAAAHFAPQSLGVPVRPLAALAGAGVLVGVGTRWSGGCTSGHGVVGLSRFSLRSLVATATFMVAGGVSTFVAGRIWAVAP
jgi:hypothetical protein